MIGQKKNGWRISDETAGRKLPTFKHHKKSRSQMILLTQWREPLARIGDCLPEKLYFENHGLNQPQWIAADLASNSFTWLCCDACLILQQAILYGDLDEMFWQTLVDAF